MPHIAGAKSGSEETRGTKWKLGVVIAQLLILLRKDLSGWCGNKLLTLHKPT